MEEIDGQDVPVTHMQHRQSQAAANRKVEGHARSEDYAEKNPYFRLGQVDLPGVPQSSAPAEKTFVIFLVAIHLKVQKTEREK